MSSCNPVIDPFQAVDAKLDVSSKYKQLMEDSLAEDSLYMRMKDTMYQQFKDLQLTEKEKAGMISDFMTKYTVDLAKYAMSQGMDWAKEERDGAYTLAKIKADTETAQAQVLLVAEQICKAENETALICAQTTSTTAGSIRENGEVATFAEDGCTPLTLKDEGVKYEQTQQIIADTYTRFADAYRKSGVVQVGIDAQDSVKKGLSGDDAGYTNQQTKNAERMRLAYEDAKRQHVANSTASMIGQMLTAEIAPNQADVQRWRDAVDFLNTCDPSTHTANC